MHTQEQIFVRVKAALVDVFEINPDTIVLDAHLSDDLDIDSIDAVDLIAELRDLLPRKIETEEFNSVVTVRDLVQVLQDMVNQ